MSGCRTLSTDEKAEIIRRVGVEAREKDPSSRISVFVRDETDEEGRPIVMVRSATFAPGPRHG
jgi:hypothetical protein